MKIWTLLALVLFISISAMAQPSYVGALTSITSSDGRDGNGTSVGLTLKGAYKLPKNFEVVAEGTYSRDPKIYRNQSGNAFRTVVLARGYYKAAFAEGGFFAGHIHFPATAPTNNDAYTKTLVQPVVGAGYELAGRQIAPLFTGMDLIGEYQYYPTKDLTAAGSSFGGIVDGKSTTHKIGVSIIYPIVNSWVALYDITWSRSTYQRNPFVYGNAFAGIQYPSNAWQFRIGVGKLLKK